MARPQEGASKLLPISTALDSSDRAILEEIEQELIDAGAPLSERSRARILRYLVREGIARHEARKRRARSADWLRAALRRQGRGRRQAHA